MHGANGCMGPTRPALLKRSSMARRRPPVPFPLSLLSGLIGRSGRVGHFGGLGQFLVCRDADNAPFDSALSTGEVQEALRKTSNASAPGTDGVRKQYLLNWDPGCEKLTRMFNVWWFTGVVPVCFKRCRTVLLPKTWEGAAMEIGRASCRERVSSPV